MKKSVKVAPTRGQSEKANDKLMDQHMARVARIHEENDGTGPDWVFHQIIRFMHDGYPHHAGGLFQRLLAEEGETLRVRGLRMVLQSEADKPTPFGWLRPVKVGSPAARKRLRALIELDG
jgi:hypothetical protein